MPYDLTKEEDQRRFRFEVERHVLGKTIRGINVTNDHVTLALEDGRGIMFRVNGPDIEITIVPDRKEPGVPTLLEPYDGPVQ